MKLRCGKICQMLCSPVYNRSHLSLLEPSFDFLWEKLNPKYLELAGTLGPTPNFKDRLSGQGQATR